MFIDGTLSLNRRRNAWSRQNRHDRPSMYSHRPESTRPVIRSEHLYGM